MKQNTSRASTNLLSALVGAFSLILIIAFCGVGGAGGCALLVGAADAVDVRVEVTKPASSTNAPYLKLGNTYATFLTLYYLDENGKKVWSGFTTREDDGAQGGNTIFELEPGVDTIEGVTIGSQRMQEGSRANLHIPSALAYGEKQIGNPGTGLYVPAGADIIFDIEVFGRVDPNGPGWFMDEDVGLPRQREEL